MKTKTITVQATINGVVITAVIDPGGIVPSKRDRYLNGGADGLWYRKEYELPPGVYKKQASAQTDGGDWLYGSDGKLVFRDSSPEFPLDGSPFTSQGLDNYIDQKQIQQLIYVGPLPA